MNIRNIIIISATLVLAACSSQDDPFGGKLDSPVAAEFSGNIENVATRASGTSWEANDAIGITGGDFTNIKYVTESVTATGAANFTPANESKAIFFKANQGTTEFKAYYPYSDEYSKNSGIISASTESQTKADQANFDFLWAKALASHDTPTANFTFSHKMTKLILNIQWNADNSGISKTEFESATFALGGVKLNGEFNTTTGEALATGTATEKWSLTAQSREEGDKKAIRSFNLILFPQSDGTQTENPTLTVIVTIGNQDYACDITPTLAPGTSYTYTITVKKVGLEVSTSNINNWVNGGSDYTGEATPKPYDPFNGHPAVLMREASGSTPALYFAECNIGASNPEEAGLYFWWGDIEGHPAGSGFNFGMNYAPANSTYGKDASALISSGFVTETSDGNLCLEKDAARQLWQGDWRIPTKSELDWLIDNGTWTWTSQNGVEGYKVKSDTTTGEIFLPCTGYYYGTTLNCIGTTYNWGYYWSSSPVSNNTNQSYFLGFWSNPHEVTPNSRYFGMSIRGVVTQ